MKMQRVEKGVQHKYVSRKKIKGRWVYVYPEKKGGKGRHDAGAKVSAKAFDGGFSVGDSFSAGAGKGHWHVKEIKDGQVSYKDDTTGEVKSLSVGDFKKTLLDAHKDAIQTHVSDGLKQREAVLEAAKKYGSDKQKARAEKLLGDWIKQHKEYLPKETESKSEAAEAKPAASSLQGDNVERAEKMRANVFKSPEDLRKARDSLKVKSEENAKDDSPKAKKRQAAYEDAMAIADAVLSGMAKESDAAFWNTEQPIRDPFGGGAEVHIEALTGASARGDARVTFAGAPSPTQAQSDAVKAVRPQIESAVKAMAAREPFKALPREENPASIVRDILGAHERAAGKEKGAEFKKLQGRIYTLSRSLNDFTKDATEQELGLLRSVALAGHPNPQIHEYGMKKLKQALESVK